ncbi:MAG: hypothetical protein JW704_00185 [Anaerolineaceae bacterium]|nr:hypothetical protein [Anaerolineaceae bacterium]
MAFSPQHLAYIETVRRNLPAGMRAWLVGGALRDQLLEHPLRDMDFVLPAGTHQVAAAVAQDLGGVAFTLDVSRDTQRVILHKKEGAEFYLDFILQNGKDIQADLADRDFTINAMAVELTDLDELVDPLGGLADLRAKIVRACAPGAMQDDPVRCLRGLRLANSLDFQIDKDTVAWIRNALPKIEDAAHERIRDELFREFEGRHVERALRVLDVMGGIDVLFPELMALRKTEQTAPHQLNAWDHSLEALGCLEEVTAILNQKPDPEGSGNWLMGMVSMHLGRYREQISEYLYHSQTPPRTRYGLLFFAALYHDAGKPETATIGEDKRRHFYRHDKAGLPLIVQRALQLALSRDESDWLGCVVRNHMRIHHLANQDGVTTPHAVYRFFRATGDTGVAICLLSLADLLATYGTTITREVLERELIICKQLLAAWWERPNDILDPPVLLDGKSIMVCLHLEPGPLVGEILEAIRLGQVEGRVKTHTDALKLARDLLKQKQANQDGKA